MKRSDRSLSATCEPWRAGLFVATATAISHVSSAAKWTRILWASNGSEMTFLFSTGEFPNTLDEDRCSSNVGAPALLLCYRSIVAGFTELDIIHSLAGRSPLAIDYVSIIASYRFDETASNILGANSVLTLQVQIFPGREYRGPRDFPNYDRSRIRRSSGIKSGIKTIGLFYLREDKSFGAPIWNLLPLDFLPMILGNPSMMLIRLRVSNNLFLMRHY